MELEPGKKEVIKLVLERFGYNKYRAKKLILAFKELWGEYREVGKPDGKDRTKTNKPEKDKTDTGLDREKIQYSCGLK